MTTSHHFLVTLLSLFLIDVVVDSVTRPSMSSVGFVTFKTITPVTVSTSAPLTYNGSPIDVGVAPETRDIVWKNIQVSLSSFFFM